MVVNAKRCIDGQAPAGAISFLVLSRKSLQYTRATRIVPYEQVCPICRVYSTDRGDVQHYLLDQTSCGPSQGPSPHERVSMEDNTSRQFACLLRRGEAYRQEQSHDLSKRGKSIYPLMTETSADG